MGKKIPLEQRLAESVSSDGYPSVAFGHGRTFRLSRVIWERSNGQIPAGILVCHHCDRPRCVNLDHFFLGRPKDNTQDMWDKGRFPVRRGDLHHATKIPDREIAIVISRRTNGEALKAIAKDYGVSFQSISRICTGARKCG
jgi:hypothetical protein